MFDCIIEAAKNFCIHQLDQTPEIIDKKCEIKNGAIVAYIDIEDTIEKYRIFLVGSKDFVQMVAKVFLEETKSDNETLLDMAKECTNMIVGNAKVIAQDKDINFNISTPHIQELDSFDEDYEKFKTINCNGSSLLVCLKKIPL